MSTWEVVESASTPKKAGANEDVLVLRRDTRGELLFAAVIDGATDKSGRSYGDLTGGALAARHVAAALERLGPEAEAAAAVAAITAELDTMRAHWNIDPEDRVAPSAVAVIFAVRARQVWRVGDSHLAWRAGGAWTRHVGEKAVDVAAASARAAYLTCLLEGGATVAELAAEDPGRAMILPILMRQSQLANSDAEHPFAYGVLDGTAVPARFIETFTLPGDVEEVVMASDGYLDPAETLTGAEDELAVSLAGDPLRIGDRPATKGLAPGANSFDDRTYVRLQLR